MTDLHLILHIKIFKKNYLTTCTDNLNSLKA